jgi:hypothetical protein
MGGECVSPFELMMLGLFGISWPVSVYKTWKTKQTVGKSLVFIIAILVGYIAGIIHKLLYSLDYVLVLYCINLINVSLDLILYLYYSKYPGGKKHLAMKEIGGESHVRL